MKSFKKYTFMKFELNLMSITTFITRTDSKNSTWKRVPLETTSLFLDRQIVYVEISNFTIITKIFGVLKTRTTFWYNSALLEQ